jgi:hypothetical protein
VDEASQRAAIALMRQIGSLLRSLSPEEIDDLASGRARITIEQKSRASGASRRVSQEMPDPDLVRSRLSALPSREEGRAYLDSLKLNRPSLRRLALALDLPVPRTDSVERIKDRIVEGTIGYRLRSEAIRGRDEG